MGPGVAVEPSESEPALHMCLTASVVVEGRRPTTMGILRSTVQRLSTESLIETNYHGAACLWLITTGRSGTQTLSRLFEGMPGFAAGHEPFPELTYEGRLAIEGRGLGLEPTRRMLHVARGRLVEGAYCRKQVWFECSLNLSHMAQAIKQAFCMSRFVHLVRQPRDFVVSALAKKWFRDDTTQSFFWPKPEVAEPAGMPGYEDVAEWAPWQRAIWFWNTVHHRGLELEDAWGPEGVHRVQSEQLWSDPEVYEGLLNWIGTDGPEALTHRVRGHSYTVLAQGGNAAPDKGEWNPMWEPFLTEIAGETMGRIYG